MADKYGRYPAPEDIPPRSVVISMWMSALGSSGIAYYFFVFRAGMQPNKDTAMEAATIGVAVGLISLKVMMTIRKRRRGARSDPA